LKLSVKDVESGCFSTEIDKHAAASRIKEKLVRTLNRPRFGGVFALGNAKKQREAYLRQAKSCNGECMMVY
jgi:hypothetical protein